jgi:hypothetical protein
MEEKIFTLSEARTLLPTVRKLTEEIAEQWERMRELNPEIQKARDNAPLDGYSRFGVDYVQAVTHLMALMQQIKDMGVLLKDPGKGLCDFPYMKDGRMVYLCWQLGEDSIQFWHDVETGFAGREPLDETDK